MSFIITTRNPQTQKLIVVFYGYDEDSDIAEYATEGEASQTVDEMKMCQAWGYEIVEVP